MNELQAAAEQPQPKVQPAIGVQACRPEDRAMLSTPAGAELLTKVAMALTVPQAVATAPKRIWLQVSDDRADMDEPFPGDGATWCADSVVDAEVEYVRADLAPPPSAPEPSEAEVAAANEALYRVLFSIEAGAHKTVLELRRAAMLEALRAAAAARGR